MHFIGIVIQFSFLPSHPVEENEREAGECVDTVWTGSGPEQKSFSQ